MDIWIEELCKYVFLAMIRLKNVNVINTERRDGECITRYHHSTFNAHTIKSFGIDCLAYFISVLMKNARYIRHFFASVWLLFIFHLYMEGFIREMHRIEVNKCINGFMWKIPFLIFLVLFSFKIVWWWWLKVSQSIYSEKEWLFLLLRKK